MPILFSGKPGRADRFSIEDPQIMYLPFSIEGDGEFSFDVLWCLVVRIFINEATNSQIMHTLGGAIYVYVFGDRVGEMMVSGICATDNCDTSTDGVSKPHGVNKLRDWYNKNKMSVRDKPLAITVGSHTFRCYLTNLSIDTMDVKTSMFQFRMSLFVLPE